MFTPRGGWDTPSDTPPPSDGREAMAEEMTAEPAAESEPDWLSAAPGASPSLGSLDASGSVVGSSSEAARIEIGAATAVFAPATSSTSAREAAAAAFAAEIDGRHAGSSLDQQADYPPSFCCPITATVMSDPVVAKDGQSYERAAIEKWLRRNKTSPVSRLPLSVSELTPNRTLKDVIDHFTRERSATDLPQRVRGRPQGPEQTDEAEELASEATEPGLQCAFARQAERERALFSVFDEDGDEDAEDDGGHRPGWHMGLDEHGEQVPALGDCVDGLGEMDAALEQRIGALVATQPPLRTDAVAAKAARAEAALEMMMAAQRPAQCDELHAQQGNAAGKDPSPIRVMPEEMDPPDQPAAGGMICWCPTPGQVVEVFGLTGSLQYNGKVGWLEDYESWSCRWTVEFPDKVRILHFK